MLQAITNAAAELGPIKFPWWRDWRGETVAIVACGPSADKHDFSVLRGCVKVLAIKEAYLKLVPFADVVYGCEAPWWQHVKGLPGFKGLKLAYSDARLDEYRDIRRFKLRANTGRRAHVQAHLDEIILDEPGTIGAGGHSGFQALNIAAQFGATRVMLIGFDMHAGGGVHFYGRNRWQRANNPDNSVFPRWIASMERASETLGAAGVQVVNCSPVSAIQSFPKKSIADALHEWGIA